MLCICIITARSKALRQGGPLCKSKQRFKQNSPLRTSVQTSFVAVLAIFAQSELSHAANPCASVTYPSALRMPIETDIRGGNTEKQRIKYLFTFFFVWRGKYFMKSTQSSMVLIFF